MNVSDKGAKTLKKLEHHADWLLDLESWPEIKSVFDCKIEEVKENED